MTSFSEELHNESNHYEDRFKREVNIGEKNWRLDKKKGDLTKLNERLEKLSKIIHKFRHSSRQ